MRETFPPQKVSAAFETRLKALQEALGHTWKDPQLLRLALTHPGVTRDPASTHLNNQRLEFLGDAMLSAVIAEAIFQARPREREGTLTGMRSALANGKSLSRIALRLGLDRCLILHEDETQVTNRALTRAVEDALEAGFGALYLDAGWDTTRRVILGCFEPLEAHLAAALDDTNPKGRLQEIVQPIHGNSALSYQLVSAEGPDHNKVWRVRVLLFSTPLGEGSGATKKIAEETAARSAMALADLAERVQAIKPH